MAASIMRRALLYVPASSKRYIEKSKNLKLDCVVYDLEDSVTPAKKVEARHNLAHLFAQPKPDSIREQAVRINSVDSGLALDDLTQLLKAPNIDAIVVPKVHSASDVHFITDVIRHMQPDRHPSHTEASSNPMQQPLRIIALIESAKAIMNLASICAASPYLSGLIFAAEDFALDLSLTRTPDLSEFLYARSAMVTAARAYALPSVIDLVCTSYEAAPGLARLKEECLAGKAMGFNGKQCIHPSQVQVAQTLFSPSEQEVEWAARVLAAGGKADRIGKAAWTLDGKMIDLPVVRKAQTILHTAGLCEIDVTWAQEKWAHQEPE